MCCLKYLLPASMLGTPANQQVASFCCIILSITMFTLYNVWCFHFFLRQRWLDRWVCGGSFIHNSILFTAFISKIKTPQNNNIIILLLLLFWGVLILEIKAVNRIELCIKWDLMLHTRYIRFYSCGGSV